MHAIAQMNMLVVKQKMNMVIHKAPRNDIHSKLLAFRSNQPNQIEPIFVILKYELVGTPLLDDMVKPYTEISRAVRVIRIPSSTDNNYVTRARVEKTYWEL